MGYMCLKYIYLLYIVLLQIPFFNDKNIASVAAGTLHSLCLDITGRNLYSFGSHGDGQLGVSRDAIDADHCETSPIPVYLNHGDTATDNKVKRNPIIRSISCGDKTSMAVTESGHLYTWGKGEQSALGHGTCDDCFLPKKVKVEKVIMASGGGEHNMVITETGRDIGNQPRKGSYVAPAD